MSITQIKYMSSSNCKKNCLYSGIDEQASFNSHLLAIHQRITIFTSNRRKTKIGESLYLQLCHHMELQYPNGHDQPDASDKKQQIKHSPCTKLINNYFYFNRYMWRSIPFQICKTDHSSDSPLQHYYSHFQQGIAEAW